MATVQHLVFGLQHQQVGHGSKGQAEADHLRLRDVIGKLTYVDNFGRRVAFELLTVVAIGCGGRKRGRSLEEPGSWQRRSLSI